MFYSKINSCDIANGPGVRVTIFVSGCSKDCEGCFSPQTHSFSYGSRFNCETLDYLLACLDKPYITGLTLLGGDPLEPQNQLEVLKIAKTIKKKLPNKTIWCYTGFYLYELMDVDHYSHTDITNELLNLIDVLVDGPFIKELADASLMFRGSSNQRLIDLKQTLLTGSFKLYKD